MRLSRMTRVAIAAAVLMASSMVLGAVAALADCSRGAPPSDMSAYRGNAFIGTISRVTRNAAQTWSVTFDVERVLAGTVRDPLTVLDVGGDCGQLRPDALHGGDRVIVTFDRYHHFSNPWLSSVGDVLVWRASSPRRWQFFDRALTFGFAEQYYPQEARAATSTAVILGLVAPGLPPTDAASEFPVPTPGNGDLAVLGAALAVAAWFSLRRRSRRQMQARLAA